MPFEVRVCSDEDEMAWQGLLSRAHNATIFHDTRFLAYHPKGKFETCHLLFLEEGRLVSAMPAALESEQGTRVLRSPCGASWGGLLLPAGLGAREVYGLVESMTGFSRELGAERIEIVLPPIVYLERQDQVQEFCLLAAGFRMVKAEITEVIYLPDFLEASLSSPYRRGVNKAERERVVVRESRDFESFHRVLCEDRAEKGAVPVHSLGDLERIEALLPGRMRLFVALAEGEVVGGALLFIACPRTVLNMYLCQTPEARPLRVANLLMRETAVWARSAGFTYYDLGTSSIGMLPNWGLSRFKEGFLGRGYLRPTFIYELRGAGGSQSPGEAGSKGGA